MYGGENAILTLAKNFDKDRFNLSLLCMRRPENDDNQLISTARNMNIPVFEIPVRSRFDFSSLTMMRSIFQKHRIHLIHSHDFKSNFYGLLASTGLGVKRIVTVHGSTRDSILKRMYLFCDERLIYRFFDRVIVVSEPLAIEIGRKCGNKKKVELIRNGLDLVLFEALHDKSGASEEAIVIPCHHKVFGVIGRLFPDKGHRFFLEAFARVRREYPDTTALIVGDGPSLEPIRNQIAALNLETSVILCGMRSDMRSIYRRLDFTVIPSLREGLPYVLLESLANKIAVIATTVGEIPFIITDGTNGCLVPPGNIDALEKGMLQMMCDPEKTILMTNEGYRLFMENLTAHQMVRKNEEAYLSLVV